VHMAEVTAGGIRHSGQQPSYVGPTGNGCPCKGAYRVGLASLSC
jgi:hypothetical protein